MKKTTYILLFTLLGLGVSFLIHAVIELAVVFLLVTDFDTWSLGLSWNSWFAIHSIGVIALGIAGLLFGYIQGKHWWNVVYIEGKRKVK